MQEAITPTRDQEELSKWFNHTWDPNSSSRLQQPERATSDAENFVDVRPHLQGTLHPYRRVHCIALLHMHCRSCMQERASLMQRPRQLWSAELTAVFKELTPSKAPD